MNKVYVIPSYDNLKEKFYILFIFFVPKKICLNTVRSNDHIQTAHFQFTRNHLTFVIFMHRNVHLLIVNDERTWTLIFPYDLQKPVFVGKYTSYNYKNYITIYLKIVIS